MCCQLYNNVVKDKGSNNSCVFFEPMFYLYTEKSRNLIQLPRKSFHIRKGLFPILENEPLSSWLGSSLSKTHLQGFGRLATQFQGSIPSGTNFQIQTGNVYLLVRHVPFIAKSAGFFCGSPCTKLRARSTFVQGSLVLNILYTAEESCTE